MIAVDTNILVYTVDPSDPHKSRIARHRVAELAHHKTLHLSTQVLQELYAVLYRKLRLPYVETVAIVQRYAQFASVSTTPALLIAAFQLQHTHQLQLWDAIVLQSAITGGCDTLLTEDMQHEQVIDGVRLVNPFKE